MPGSDDYEEFNPPKSSFDGVFPASESPSDFVVLPLPLPASEQNQIHAFLNASALSATESAASREMALRLIEKSRRRGMNPAAQLATAYDISSDEGRALMELAEALLRVPDSATRDALISDKIGGRDWLASSPHGFAHAAALALSAAGMVTDIRGAVLAEIAGRLGMPAVRACVVEAMKILGGHFVFAETIETAAAKAVKDSRAAYSFDMLGEAARHEEDAARYFDAYLRAVQIAGRSGRDGVSIKLSALYPRYETRKWCEVGRHLLPRVRRLVCEARRCGAPVSIDAEETARLELSLAVVRQLAMEPEIADWDGFGVVVQAYNRRAGMVIAELADIARQRGQRMPIRLVKGAYWDTEIKIAQEKGLADFPVFTRKAHTDLAFLHHAATMMNSPWIYPQIATHNAATAAAVLQIADRAGCDDFEFQRLHGMGAPLYDALAKEHPHRLRIYAPVGRRRDLLAYLVRRLLENGANTSFMHQLNDLSAPAAEMVADPADSARRNEGRQTNIRTGAALFGTRRNSRGWDMDDPAVLSDLESSVAPHLGICEPPPESSRAEIDSALHFLEARAQQWADIPPSSRANVLETFSELLEEHAPRFFGLLMSEGKKTIDDCAAELREAVDFCRYYAAQARLLPKDAAPRGVVLAVSPWNFPLAIFCGQIAAALAAGNAVLAKPAAQTPRVARAAVEMFYRAGLPECALQIIYGGGEVGAHAVAAGVADMIVFTGSTRTAKHIEIAVAESAKPHAPLLAETGGLNAMLADSSALMERAADDIIRSAFRSAGQRCSALRMLYVQEDIGDAMLSMLRGAAHLLQTGAPADFSSDIGPIIDDEAREKINLYVESARREGRLLWRGRAPGDGCFAPPAIIKVGGIDELPGEIFGPVLHIAFYAAGGENEIISALNKTGYGLTFGLHGRVSRMLDDCAAHINAGNVYINRDQIGAVVGSQPFGGRGLSGTGPKAGGPMYLAAFTHNIPPEADGEEHFLPGPDGERNCYRAGGRGKILCVSPAEKTAARYADIARAAGNVADFAVSLPQDAGTYNAVMIDPALDGELSGFRRRIALSREHITPMIRMAGDRAWLFAEKHICTNLTAAGGNAELLARAD